MINLGESRTNAWQSLLAGLFHVLPFGLATFGAMAWLDGSAYMFLMPWCLWTWVASVVIAAAGMIRGAIEGIE
ncbi:MAG: hypothetical protein HY854_26425 [Burkholderiales bacterium]|nr:hypothetical protein [Burkholderiales bacterium]